jgi:hypothetical protein
MRERQSTTFSHKAVPGKEYRTKRACRRAAKKAIDHAQAVLKKELQKAFKTGKLEEIMEKMRERGYNVRLGNAEAGGARDGVRRDEGVVEGGPDPVGRAEDPGAAGTDAGGGGQLADPPVPPLDDPRIIGSIDYAPTEHRLMDFKNIREGEGIYK